MELAALFSWMIHLLLYCGVRRFVPGPVATGGDDLFRFAHIFILLSRS